MNPFSAIATLFHGMFQMASRAHIERDQEGPQGRANDDALKASGEAYYRKHGTYEGWVFDDKTMTGNE